VLRDSPVRRTTIAKNQNTYAKRKREMDKKNKAEDKRVRRAQRKQETENPSSDSPAANGIDPSNVPRDFYLN
jgi:hypothetical protein